MKTNDMNGNFYKCDFLPNKLAYVIGKSKEGIDVLFFCNEKNTGFKAHKTTVKKYDLKQIKYCFNPTQSVLDKITEYYNK